MGYGAVRHLRLCRQSQQFGLRQRSTDDPAAVDLAVEESGNPPFLLLCLVVVAGPEELDSGVGRLHVHPPTAPPGQFQGRDRGDQVAVAIPHRLLQHREHTAFRVEYGGCEIPLPRSEGDAGIHHLHRSAISQPEGQLSGVVDTEAVTATR